MIDLSTQYLSDIKNILLSKVPNLEVRVFGSRVNGNASRYSDLDLAIVGKEKIDWRIIEELKDEFSESNLPIMVDVLDWNAISEEFREIINQHYEVIQSPKL